ncbi:MAG: rod shape-determining protein MreC [bacterium]|nr:rod shape-determining protein MreC [bacterium]
MGRRRNLPGNTPLIVGAVAVLVLGGAIGLLRPLEGLVGLMLEPVAKAVQITGKSDLERENAELQKEIGELRSELAKREEAVLENDALKAQLGFAEDSGYALTEADIISQDPTNYQQVLTIDRGSSAGIKKGMVAVTQGLLVGQVVATTPSTAKVRLITDFGSAVPALAQQTRASGLIRGGRGFGLELEMVPQTDELRAGDTLLTSGFGTDYPKGLVVGTVDRVEKHDTDVFQTAEVKPAVDLRRLERLFIITGRR